MQRILEGLPDVECQMDDIIVHGANQAEHDKRLEAVITRTLTLRLTVTIANSREQLFDFWVN